MPLEETQAGRHLSAGGRVVGWEVSGYMDGGRGGGGAKPQLC